MAIDMRRDGGAIAIQGIPQLAQMMEADAASSLIAACDARVFVDAPNDQQTEAYLALRARRSSTTHCDVDQALAELARFSISISGNWMLDEWRLLGGLAIRAEDRDARRRAPRRGAAGREEMMREVTAHLTRTEYRELCWHAVAQGAMPADVLAGMLGRLAAGGDVPIARLDWVDVGEEGRLAGLSLDVPDGVASWLDGHAEGFGGTDALCRRLASALVPPGPDACQGGGRR